jgi:hypothetical protein
MIAALYVDPRGPYPAMDNVDCWDIERDARLYDGPHPVVAHPPCGPWGKLKHLYRGDEHDCALVALAQVRRFGGVLEHPAKSKLWAAQDIPTPGSFPDRFGGFSVAVDQCAWGHVARKPTWLYIVGVNIQTVVDGIRVGGTPTHWASGSRVNSSKSSTRQGSPVPHGIKVCSAQQRRRTPAAFAQWLVSLARTARPGNVESP